jgi:hypothetical protein
VAGREPFASGLDNLLSQDEVVGHELVFGELLVGDRGGRANLLVGYALMQQSTLVPHEEVTELVRRRDLRGRGVGWIDVHLLASALVDRSSLWTADASLATLARELGVERRRRGARR